MNMLKKETFDVSHPWFRPVWVRILVAGICIAWTTIEFVNGNTGWALVFGAASAYLLWAFFVTWTDPLDPEAEAEVEPESEAVDKS